MAEQFKDQGGAATMDPSPVARWIGSKLIGYICSDDRLHRRRRRFEDKRRKTGEPHRVEYFHQAEDGYSHLAAQVLPALAARYDIELHCHLVRGPRGKNAPEPDLLLQLSRYDSHLVAGEYGLQFPEHERAPDDALVQQAGRILAAQDSAGFVAHAADVGAALWAADARRLEQLAQQLGQAPEAEFESRLEAGSERRAQLKHYSGAMLHYGGEWYWGVDRLYHLEKRLAELGADRRPGEALLVPRPPVEPAVLKDDGHLTLEVYPSLRSPYTSIAFDRTLRLAQDYGVSLNVRPVLPMVMRGVPATREKGLYIFSDTLREAREAGVAYGKCYDPIGEPVRRAYSLYPWACEQGRGNEFLSAFLRAAFAEGVNTNRESGLKHVVESAGLDWGVARDLVGQPGWEALLEENRLAMYEAGLWGVPSYRLLDENGGVLLAIWGQDRLWLVARTIQRQLARRQQGA